MRRKIFFLVPILALTISASFAQNFEQYFHNETMRVDYYHTGTKGQETISLDRVYREGPWPGSRINLVDTLNLGEYYVRITDATTNILIYSRGYSTIFNEWQTTDEANSGMYRTFHETVRFPFPLRKIQLIISRRDRQMIFHEIFSTIIDPSIPRSIQKETQKAHYTITTFIKNGPPEKKVDLLLLGDGYTKKDMEKFRADVAHFIGVLFNTHPFKERKSDFNVWTIEVESDESGIDKPDKDIWKNSTLGATYNTFNSVRYVLTEENRRLRDIAAAVPYDFISILVNDNRYGGGGIFNLYSTCFTSTDQPGQEWQPDYVFVHEFGHSFGGLGDEYYSSQVSYVDFYSKGIEPWEPNITALLDPNNLKWKIFVDPGTPIPTPWKKSLYDSLERERAKLDRLAADYYEKREPLMKGEQEILNSSQYKNTVGAFEGAGYVSEGLYRPSIDCRMFSLSLVDFDRVCSEAIERMIDFYTH
ncbi:MAG: M64 family metallopeptidase [Bacteroidota bacterium]